MLRLASFTATTVLLGSLTHSAVALQPSPGIKEKFDEKAYAEAYDNYAARHPNDILGQARVAAQHGVIIESVTIPERGIRNKRPADAQRILDKAINTR